MWRSSAIPKANTPSPPASPTSFPVEENGSSAFRRRTPLVPKSTLSEALRTNPFRNPSTAGGAEPKIKSQLEYDAVLHLNKDLKVLSDIYPDVKIEVLRELLLRFDGDSRLQICTEQLIKYKSEWARGRVLNPPRQTENAIPVEDLFRNISYIAACKLALCTEFKSLNKSAIEAVLAEVNQSYSKARPILQGIEAKSWRATFTLLFKRRKGLDEIPSSLIDKKSSRHALQPTGDGELDRELEQLFIAGLHLRQKELQESRDLQLATVLNFKEAEEAEALFECQVCYNDVPFEFVSACTEHAHVICCDCVRRTLKEAIFGQGWAQSIDVQHATMRCIASDGQESCSGHIASLSLQNIILSSELGPGTWEKFEQRLATDNIMRSGLSLVSCPFCHYAESPQPHTISTAHFISWRFRKQEITLTILLSFVVAEFVLPTALLLIALTMLFDPVLPRRLFYTALINYHQQLQTRRFRCQNPTCSRVSCLSCSKSWHDPHTCHEPLILSLRTAVEAARTAALKRTCPRCGTSFIKSSGCNKLTCVCGYAMCYLCRKNIGKVNSAGAVDEREGGEGYRHFCEHFRPMPGQKCTECTKCDLYMNEDEEALVKRAGEEAEREWREKEGMVGVKGLGLEEAVVSLGKLKRDDVVARAWDRFLAGEWTTQEICDWIVSKIIIVEN